MVYEIREPGTRAIVNFNKVLTPYIHKCSGFPDLMIRTPQVTDQYKKNNKVSNRHFGKNDIGSIWVPYVIPIHIIRNSLGSWAYQPLAREGD